MSSTKKVFLVLKSEGLDSSRLQDITRDLASSLRELNVGHIELPEHSPDRGKKGIPVDIGSIVMTLIGSGGVVVSLITVLKAYIERKPTLAFQFSRPDGKKIDLHAENLSEGQLEKTMRAATEFLKE